MIIITILFVWNLILSFFIVTAILGSFYNYKETEAIKSWYPFCELVKMKKHDMKMSSAIDIGCSDAEWKESEVEE